MIADKNGINESDVVDNAETLDDLTKRQKEFVKFVANHVPKIEPPDHCRVFVVSHGAFIRNFLSVFCGLENIGKIINCSATKIWVDYFEDDNGNNKFECSIDSRVVNFVDHLSNETSDTWTNI